MNLKEMATLKQIYLIFGKLELKSGQNNDPV